MQIDREYAKVIEMRLQRGHRGSYVAAITLLVLAQLATLSHSARVQHVRCAAHDELVEAADVDAHSSDATRLVGVRAAQGADEHCGLAATLHTSTHAPAHHVAPVVAGTVALATAPPPQVVVRTTVYLIAPKTSPPDRRVSIT